MLCEGWLFCPILALLPVPMIGAVVSNSFRQFLICRNSEIRVWTLGGDAVYTLSGHTSFVYSVSVLPSGDVVSAGEDRTVRVWKGTSFPPFYQDVTEPTPQCGVQTENVIKLLCIPLSQCGPFRLCPMETLLAGAATELSGCSARPRNGGRRRKP